MNNTETQSRHSVQRIAGCKHRGSWIIGGGSYEWCYCCGALRQMKQTGHNSCAPDSPWCKPAGVRCENPWDAWQKSSSLYRQRRQHNDKLSHAAEQPKTL